MLQILPLRDKTELIKLYGKSNIELKNNCMAVSAVCDDEIIGYALFSLDKQIVIYDLQPREDIPLADGILRAALHVAVENGVLEARYQNTGLKPILKRLRFIQNDDKCTLNIEKLFSSCQSCENT
ncbi:MAG: hypothetical protein RR177_00555 [Oscillospiraceae bacterium]